MKSQTDLESKFREAEKRLEIEPSAQAWSKLERRLDHRPTHAKIRSVRRWMSVAASFIVLVGSLYFWHHKNVQKVDYLPTIVEELGDNPQCEPFCMLLKNRKELPAYYAAPVRETVN